MVPPEIVDQSQSEFLRKGTRKSTEHVFSSFVCELIVITEAMFTHSHKVSPQCFSGIAGDWKNLLTKAEAEHFDAVYKEQMKDVGYKFAWD